MIISYGILLSCNNTGMFTGEQSQQSPSMEGDEHEEADEGEGAVRVSGGAQKNTQQSKQKKSSKKSNTEAEGGAAAKVT